MAKRGGAQRRGRWASLGLVELLGPLGLPEVLGPLGLLRLLGLAVLAVQRHRAGGAIEAVGVAIRVAVG